MNGAVHAHTWFNRSNIDDPNDPISIFASSSARENNVLCVKCLQTFTLGQTIQGCHIPDPSVQPKSANVGTPIHVKNAVMSRHFYQVIDIIIPLSHLSICHSRMPSLELHSY